MPVRVRSLDVTTDLPRVAAIIALVDAEHVTTQDLAASILRTDGLHLHLAAMTESRHVIGYASWRHFPWDRLDKAAERILVDPAYRGRGAGSALHSAGEAYARAHGLTHLACEVADTDAAALGFAQRRGFAVNRHHCNSFLDPLAFDEAPFAGVVETAETGGIRFFSFAEESSPEHEHMLYDLYVRTAPDIPGNDSPGMEPFAEWRRAVLEHRTSRPDCLLVAADGDRFVGVTHMAYDERDQSMFTWYTAVAPSHRGRNIALALKLLSIRAARRYGARRLGTSNDSLNAPMLAINRKLGYRNEPGTLVLSKDVV